MQPRNHLFGFAVLALSFVLAGGSAGAAPRAPLLPAGVDSPPAATAGKTGQIVLAQANDPRLMTLEEEIRRLNGRLEELNFQILQMQDQMRRMQEDTEFRFQELEGNGGGAASDQRTERIEPAVPSAPAGQDTATVVTPVPENPGQAASAAPVLEPLPGVETVQRGAPPRELGTITFDENGNLVAAAPGSQPIDLLQGTPAASGDAVVAALPPSNDPEELYRNAYEFILSGDYRTAEAGFRQYLERFPEGDHVPDANFWLGEAILGQDRYREAAEVFLQANRSYPEAAKAPEMLLKLGVSLTAMNQRDVACATYTEIGHRYPNISPALKERVKQEQALAGC